MHAKLRNQYKAGDLDKFNKGAEELISDNNIDKHLDYAAKILSLFRAEEVNIDFGYRNECELIWGLLLHPVIIKKLFRQLIDIFLVEKLMFIHRG